MCCCRNTTLTFEHCLSATNTLFNIERLCINKGYFLTHQQTDHYDAHSTAGTDFINMCEISVFLVSEEAEHFSVGVLLFSPVSIIPTNEANYHQPNIRIC
jgi:5-hydroxyisourate hydrolase-like protein (transthyretin family)